MTMTYGELKTAVQDFVQSTETSFVNNLPLFIRLAEERIMKNVRLNLFQKNASGTTTSGNKYVAAPSDFLAPISLSLTIGGEQTFLLLKNADFVQEYIRDSASGAPVYFGQYDVDNLILAPIPDSAYALEMHYLYRPASLTAGSDSGTTWLSQNAEVALLYGTLVEAYTYLKGDQDLMVLYSQRFAEALQRLKNLGEGLETTDEYRTGKLMRPKT
jgi:hypothetical protein